MTKEQLISWLLCQRTSEMYLLRSDSAEQLRYWAPQKSLIFSLMFGTSLNQLCIGKDPIFSPQNFWLCLEFKNLFMWFCPKIRRFLSADNFTFTATESIASSIDSEVRFALLIRITQWAQWSKISFSISNQTKKILTYCDNCTTSQLLARHYVLRWFKTKEY